MVNAAAVRGLIERYARAEALVNAGAVQAVKGVEHFFFVASSTGQGGYLADLSHDAERCSCEDFKRRGKASGTPCKHLLAAELFAESAAAHKAAKPAQPTSPASAAVDDELLNEVIFGHAR